MTLSLTTQPPCTGPYTNAVNLTTNGYVCFPDLTNSQVPNLSSLQNVKVQGYEFSPKNGATVSVYNVTGTCLLASTNLTVFSVENITHPTVKWHYCPSCMPNESALWWDYLGGQIGVALRPATNEVVGNLTVTVGDKTLMYANNTPDYQGGDHNLDLYDTGWNEIKYPATIVAQWSITNQTAQLTHPINDPGTPYLQLSIGQGFDHVCTNGVHSSHLVTVTDVNSNFPSTGPYGDLTVTLWIVTSGTGDAVFQSTGTHETNVTLTAYQATATVIGATPGDGLTLEIHVSPGCEHAWDSRAFTNFNVATLTLLDAQVPVNVRTDSTQTNEDRTASNTLYIAQGSDGTAQVVMDLSWVPAGAAGDKFGWEIKEDNDTYWAAQWSPNYGDFVARPVTSTWSAVPNWQGITNREFLVNGWFDCNNSYWGDSDEPHRQVYLTVADLKVVESGYYIVPGSTNNTIRYKWEPSSAVPNAVNMQIYDSSNTLVRTMTNLPTSFLGTNTWAEYKWNGMKDAAGTQPLAETNSPYRLDLIGVWPGGASYTNSTNALVEVWLLDIGIEDKPSGNETLVTGVDEDTVISSNLEIQISLDGNTNILALFSVSNNTEVASGPVSNQWGCLVTPTNFLFYTTPVTPYDIRYQVSITEKTSTNNTATGNGLEVKSVNDGTLNLWDMDQTTGNRQTNAVWQFGINSTGSPPTAVSRNLQETYQ